MKPKLKGEINMEGLKVDPKTGKVDLRLLSIYWYQVKGMSFEEIADRLQEPVSTIKSWIETADQKLNP